jgi:hypothetical protein
MRPPSMRELTRGSTEMVLQWEDSLIGKTGASKTLVLGSSPSLPAILF